MTLITLNGRERRVLEQLIISTAEATTLRRAQAVLWLAQGESVAAVAQRLHVTRQAVYKWAARVQACSAKELAAHLAEAERSGRPCSVSGIIDPLIDAVIDTDPRALGYRSTVWTAPLLAQYLADHHPDAAALQLLWSARTTSLCAGDGQPAQAHPSWRHQHCDRCGDVAHHL